MHQCGLHDVTSDITHRLAELCASDCSATLGVLHLAGDWLSETNEVSGAHIHDTAITDDFLALFLHILRAHDILHCHLGLPERFGFPLDLLPFLQELK